MGVQAPGRLMRAPFIAIASLAALAIPALASAAPTIADMRGHRRVLIVNAASPAGKRVAQQRQVLAHWRHGAAARDLTLVTINGTQVTGAADRSTLMRRRWHLPPGDFQVVLVGKDGREAARWPHPVSAATLQRTIDAMPMRRAGQR